jgi:hypothetical protein
VSLASLSLASVSLASLSLASVSLASSVGVIHFRPRAARLSLCLSHGLSELALPLSLARTHSLSLPRSLALSLYLTSVGAQLPRVLSASTSAEMYMRDTAARALSLRACWWPQGFEPRGVAVRSNAQLLLALGDAAAPPPPAGDLSGSGASARARPAPCAMLGATLVGATLLLLPLQWPSRRPPPPRL